MSSDLEKVKHSRRRQQNNTAIEKQIKIAKQHGMVNKYNQVDEPHRFAKHHVMDCGNPECSVCSNPRKLYGELTIQEKRLFQTVD